MTRFELANITLLLLTTALLSSCCRGSRTYAVETAPDTLIVVLFDGGCQLQIVGNQIQLDEFKDGTPDGLSASMNMGVDGYYVTSVGTMDAQKRSSVWQYFDSTGMLLYREDSIRPVRELYRNDAKCYWNKEKIDEDIEEARVTYYRPNGYKESRGRVIYDRKAPDQRHKVGIWERYDEHGFPLMDSE